MSIRSERKRQIRELKRAPTFEELSKVHWEIAKKKGIKSWTNKIADEARQIIKSDRKSRIHELLNKADLGNPNAKKFPPVCKDSSGLTYSTPGKLGIPAYGQPVKGNSKQKKKK